MTSVRSRGALIGFTMVVATLAVNALISYLNVRHLHANGLAVARTDAARLALASLMRMLADAETGQRGYVITGEASYLEPYQAAITQVEVSLSELAESFSEDAAQRHNFAELQRATRRAADLIHRNVIIRQQQGFDPARQNVLVGEGKQAMDHLRDLVARMELREQQQLAERTRDSRSTYQTAVVTGFIAAALGLGLAAGGYWLVRRELLTRMQAAADLVRLNESLEARVRERTQAISDANAALRGEVEERQRAEEQAHRFAAELQASNRSLEQFASVASHDLQEPLRKIQAFGDRLQTGYREQLGEKGQDYVERMCGAATRMRKLIDDLLSYSRVATRGQPFQSVDLQQVAREVLDDLSERVRQTDGRVEVGALPTISADPLQMRQLFQNLIANALKFHRADAPPVVQVTAELESLPGGDGRPPREHWNLSFRDNGIGFEEAYAERIFGLFQRLHARGEYEGTGMGLAICRKIAERHGGSIVATGSPGQGAQFRVILPSDHSSPREDL